MDFGLEGLLLVVTMAWLGRGIGRALASRWELAAARADDLREARRRLY